MTNKEIWRQFLDDCKSIIVFDTETTGVQAGFNTILSLSWQELDSNLNTINEQTRYFDWPENEVRVSMGAININKLTRERLRELGTTDKKQELQKFSETLAESGLLVGHNAKFDIGFLNSEFKENEVETNIARHIPVFDTMVSMTTYCKIPRNGHHGIGNFKYPRLGELAQFLHVNTSDIDFHQSSSDVEVTVRCLREIVSNGLVPPTR